MNKFDLFSTWIFTGFLLFYFEFTNFNPIILIYSAIVPVAFFAIDIYKNTSDITYFYFFMFINIISKIIPIFLIGNETIKDSDYSFSVLIIIIYFLYIYIIRKKDVFKIYNDLYDSYIDPENNAKNNTFKYLKARFNFFLH